MSVKNEFTRRLLEMLWEDYARRVAYARTYQDMLAELGGRFVNDHIAFRSLAITVNRTHLGLNQVLRIFKALGFVERGAIDFPEENLFARFVQHPTEPDFPRIFSSELKVDELPPDAAKMIKDATADFRVVLSDEDVAKMEGLDSTGTIPPGLLERTFQFFREVPWSPPPEDVVHKVNEASQYGAWVLLHAYNVNHFTGSVNAHDIPGIGDIESLVRELKSRGVPMKDEIEGERGSKLRQTSTEAVHVPVKVRGADGKPKEIEWSYAYMEFAERGQIEENGRKHLFDGFLGPQATHLFDMTRVEE